MMAVVKMMLAFLGMAAVAYALPPQEEALIAKPAGQNETEVGNIRERRTGKCSSFFFPPRTHVVRLRLRPHHHPTNTLKKRT